MEYDKIKELINDMGNSKLTSLDIELPDGSKISMKKDKCVEKIIETVNSQKSEKIENENSENNGKAGKVVKSPMVGTFYIKSSPTAEPFVEIGSEVTKGETLCIIEAMKLMNEIEAEISGKITKIYVNDGEPVEYGTPLFQIMEEK